MFIDPLLAILVYLRGKCASNVGQQQRSEMIDGGRSEQLEYNWILEMCLALVFFFLEEEMPPKRLESLWPSMPSR